jgi:hypothetical protein
MDWTDADVDVNLRMLLVSFEGKFVKSILADFTNFPEASFKQTNRYCQTYYIRRWPVLISGGRSDVFTDGFVWAHPVECLQTGQNRLLPIHIQFAVHTYFNVCNLQVHCRSSSYFVWPSFHWSSYISVSNVWYCQASLGTDLRSL